MVRVRVRVRVRWEGKTLNVHRREQDGRVSGHPARVDREERGAEAEEVRRQPQDHAGAAFSFSFSFLFSFVVVEAAGLTRVHRAAMTG